jgi:hypothetical protein
MTTTMQRLKLKKNKLRLKLKKNKLKQGLGKNKQKLNKKEGRKSKLMGKKGRPKRSKSTFHADNAELLLSV